MNKGIVLVVVCLMQCINAFTQKVLHLRFEETSGIHTTKEEVSQSHLSIVNAHDRPERIPGVNGSALRFDGYSTWVEGTSFALPDISNAMTIETWYATESFTAANCAIVSQENGSSGFSVEIEPYGKVVFIFWADNTRYVLVSDNSILKYQWSHIVTTIDLPGQLAKIFVNGEEWKSLALASHTAIKLSSTPFYVGRDTDLQLFSGFPLTVTNGVLDEVGIYKNVLGTSAVIENYNMYKTAVPDLAVDANVRHPDDNLRPRYHAMPATSWTNEPYGLIHYKGKYHLFFQKNPNGPYLFFMHWGHLTSSDLVSWTEEKIALSPSPGFDSHGVWSGTTVKDPSGKPVIVYTGVNGVRAGIGVATSPDDDLLVWNELPSNPVVAQAPTDVKNNDFRDPYVWKVGSTYYMIVGSGLQFDGGGYLFTYKSSDLATWTRTKTLYNDPNTQRSGYFWEMPFFHQINDTDWVLCVTPVPSGGVRAKSIYWIGKFEDEAFVPYGASPKSLELVSENLLAPAVGTDDEGRFTYIGIIPEDRSVESQLASGWRHTFSLPRVLRLLKDSTLGQVPHPNLCRLRQNHIQVLNRVVSKGTESNLAEMSGNQSQFSFDIMADSAAKFSIQVYKNTDKSEYTSIDFDLAGNTITLDRSKSTLSVALKDSRTVAYVFDHHENIYVDVFVDHSTLEIFIDNIVVLSCRVYPSKPESNRVDVIVTNKSLNLIQADQWDIRSMSSPMGAEVCEMDPLSLPDALRRETMVDPGPVTAVGEETGLNLEIFPNPTEESLFIKLTGGQTTGSLEMVLFNADGRVLLVNDQLTNPEVNLKGLTPGVYFLKAELSGQVKYFKVLKR